MARLDREAQLLAALNHPNIAAIYGIEQNALVMEVVPGPTLEEHFYGTIRVFPNTKNLGAARFENLRAAGAFLLSAAWDGRATASPVVLVSEKGALARIAKPWNRSRIVRTRDNRTIESRSEGDVL